MSQSSEAEADPAARKLLLALGAAVFIVNLDARVVAPLLPLLAAEFGVSISRAGWLVSAYLLPYGLFQLAFGPLADRYGKITVCSHAMAAFSLGTACCALWPSFGAMITLRALTGAAAAGVIPLTLAYIGDTVPYARRQAAIATLMASGGAAQALSTSAGGMIAEIFSWRAVFPCVGALAGAAAICLYALRPRTAQVAAGASARAPYRQMLAASRMRFLLSLVMIEGFLYMGAFTYLSALLVQRFAWTAFPIGLVLGLAGAAQLTMALLLPRLLRLAGERLLLGVGGGAMGLAYLACALARHWSVVAIACCMLGGGFILCHTTLQTRATETFPSARGAAVALFVFSLFLGSGLGTVAFGSLLHRFGLAPTFALAGCSLWLFTWAATRGVDGIRILPKRSTPATRSRH
jgi:predicted MFS family arabinose efflux permease